MQLENNYDWMYCVWNSVPFVRKKIVKNFIVNTINHIQGFWVGYSIWWLNHFLIENTFVITIVRCTHLTRLNQYKKVVEASNYFSNSNWWFSLSYTLCGHSVLFYWNIFFNNALIERTNLEELYLLEIYKIK